jgi:hypothetical protein
MAGGKCRKCLLASSGDSLPKTRTANQHRQELLPRSYVPATGLPFPVQYRRCVSAVVAPTKMWTFRGSVRYFSLISRFHCSTRVSTTGNSLATPTPLSRTIFGAQWLALSPSLFTPSSSEWPRPTLPTPPAPARAIHPNTTCTSQLHPRPSSRRASVDTADWE